MKRGWAVALAGVVGAGLMGGCGQKDNAARAALVWAQTDEPRRLDPAHSKDLFEGQAAGLMHSGLLQWGPGLEVQPAVATTYTLSADGRRYRFSLAAGARRFSDGQPVRAADVRYSLSRVLWPATGSDRKWVLDKLEGAAEVMAGSTTTVRGIAVGREGGGGGEWVELTLREPWPPLVQALAMPAASIIPENSAGTATDGPAAAKAASLKYEQAPVGAGLWRLTKWERGRQLQFKWTGGAGGALAEHLVWEVAPEEQARRLAFQAGRVHLMELPISLARALAAGGEGQAGAGVAGLLRQPGAALASAEELRTDYLGMGCERPWLREAANRQRVAAAVRAKLTAPQLAALLGGEPGGAVAEGLVPAPLLAELRRTAGALAPPLAGADSMKSVPPAPGAPGRGRVALKLYYRANPLADELAARLRDWISAEVPEVAIELAPRDQAALRQAIHEGGADLYLGSWTLDYPDAENALVPPFHSRNIPRQGNGSHFRDSRADALLEAAQAERDPARRAAAWLAAERHIRGEAPWVPLYQRRARYAVAGPAAAWKPALMYNANRFERP